MNWRETILGNEIDFFNGKSIKPGQIGQYPAYGSNGIIGGSDEWKYENAIIIGRVGAYCGSVAYCPRKFWASDNTIVSKPKNHFSSVIFYYYLLHHLELNKYAGGAAQPLVTQTVLKQVSVRIPDVETQRRIASILSAYDDLIENNTRRIAILEEMARRIYEEWFVKFKFPGHEKVKMVDSELGKIPEGWKVGYLSDILESIRHATRPGDHLSNRRYVPIDCIARKSLVLPEFKPWEEAQSSLVLFEEDDILFGAMRPYFHKVCIAPFPGITRTTCFVLRARDYYAHAFGVLTAFADATVSYASAHTQGATIPYAVWDGSLADYKVLIPTIELLKIFEETVSPMLNWLKRVTFKQTNLRATRDFLLPKLISGEIDVSKLPEPEEAAA